MIRQRHVEAAGGAAGLGCVGGVGDDVGGGGLVEGLGRVGLLDGVIADGVGVKLALDHGGAGGGLGEEIGSVVAGASDADGGDVRGGEEVGDESLVVRAGSDRGEVVGGFEGLAFGAAVLPRFVGGTDVRERGVAASRQFCHVLGGGCRELPRLLGWCVGVGVHDGRKLSGLRALRVAARSGVRALPSGCVKCR